MKPLVVLVLAVLLGGCVSAKNDVADEVPHPTASDEPRIEVHHTHFNVAAGTSNVNFPAANPLAFVTPRNATALAVELVWNSTVWDLDLMLQAEWWECTDEGDGPVVTLMEQVFCVTDDAIAYERTGEFAAEGGLVGNPDSPARLMFQGDEFQAMMEPCEADCDWLAWAEENTARTSMDWHIFVSVFYGQNVPPDYTAIPWLK